MGGSAQDPGQVLHARAGGPLRGAARPPGDKSISHRAVILGGLAVGDTTVHGLLEGEDVLCTVNAMRALGVPIRQDGDGVWHITGVGLAGLREPARVLDLGNSGTGLRLLAGVLASQPFLSILTGDASLCSRPMSRVVTPLTRMGATILGRDHGRLAPLVIQGTELVPIDYQSPVASAQVKSAILLAGLNTPGESSVTEPAQSRDHTERMLGAFGAEVTRAGATVRVYGWTELRGQTLRVPADLSAAAFPLVAAALTPGSEVTLRGVGVNPTRTGLLELLAAMGADLERSNEREEGGEPVADLRIRHAPLHGIAVPPELVPRTIDEFPIFTVAAALAQGETVISGAGELRVKESDRLSAMAVGLTALGAQVRETADGMVIQGRPHGLDGGVTVDSYTDHRVAMSLLVAGLRCRAPVAVTRCDNIATSFPGFVPLMTQLGAAITRGAFGEPG